MKRPFSKCKMLTMSLAAVAIIGVTMILVWRFALPHETKKITGAVVTNGHGCSDIGKDILDKGGSVADAAIAALFCEGVSLPQSMGLGGGFLLTIYDKAAGTIESLNAREMAPGASNSTMFNGDSTLSQKGGLSVGVPGELKGYLYLHERYGLLPWKDLIQPTIDLCNNGIYVTEFLARIFLSKIDLLYQDPALREVFINPETNSTWTEGQYYKRTKFAKTLEIIAEEKAHALYNRSGSLTEGFVRDIQNHGGIITVDDLENYNPVWQDSVMANLTDGSTLYTVPSPGSGPVLAFIINILDGFLDLNYLYNVESFQKIVESFKFGYGYRTQLGDDIHNNLTDVVNRMTSKEFAEEIRTFISENSTNQNASYYGAKTVGVEDHGTAHISILAPNGDAISVTSTINLVFGAGFASNSTGIILNDEMDDFSAPNITNNFGLPPSPSNFIEPGKRPLSSMVPTIVVNNSDVVLVTGAAGGSKITTVVASIIIKHLWYNIHLVEATDEKRIHHQLFPMSIEYEEDFDLVYPDLVQNLTAIGHNSRYTPTADGFSAVVSISAKDDDIIASFDNRRGGYISQTKT